MESFISFLTGALFPLEYAIAIAIFLIPLKKRDAFPIRALLSLAVCAFAAGFGSLLSTLGLPRQVSFVLIFLSGFFAFGICCPLSLWDCVYGATCAYAAQHLAYVIYSFFSVAVLSRQDGGYVLEIGVFALVITLCYFFFARNMEIDGVYRVPPLMALTALLVIFAFAFILSMLAEGAFSIGSAGNGSLFLICRVYDALCCVFVLALQMSVHKRMHVQQEFNTSRLIWEKQKEIYEISKENIDVINKKCHDLKHQVAALRTVKSDAQRNKFIDELESSVMIYDSVMKTGNETLDTLLSEKSLLCEQESIAWTCVADGRLLDFMDPIDLFTLFGNALDNAIESVRKLSNPEKRVIALTLYSKPNMAVIQLENYYEGEIVFSDSVPVTTKDDAPNHGYGVRSIREIAGKYGGSVSIDTQDGIFLLCIVLPLQ